METCRDASFVASEADDLVYRRAARRAVSVRRACPVAAGQGRHVSRLLLEVRHVAELSSRFFPRDVSAQPIRPVIGGAHLEMKRQLVVQIAIEPPPADDGDEAMPECRNVHRHVFHEDRRNTKASKFFGTNLRVASCSS